MSNKLRWQLAALAILAAYGTRGHWMKTSDNGSGNSPVVASDPFPEITAALVADDRPERTRVLGDIFLGLAEIGVPRAAHIIAVEKATKLAIEIGLGDSPSGAGKLIAAEFAKVIDSSTLALDDRSRAVVADFFRRLSQSCREAL